MNDKKNTFKYSLSYTTYVIVFNINKSVTICKGLMKWEYLFFKLKFIVYCLLFINVKLSESFHPM